MDDYSLMDIFDSLSIFDLANVADVSPRFKEIILNHYVNAKFQLNMEWVHIELYEKRDTYINIKVPNPNESPQRMKIDEILQFLKIFGPFIKAFKLTASMNSLNRIPIVQYINEYCLNNTEQIIQFVRDFNVNDSIDLSFPNATTAIVRLEFPEIDKIAHSIDLNKIFPQMQKLHLHESHRFWLDRQFPHLTQVEFSGTQTQNPNLRAFLQSNPQIRSFKAELYWESEYMQTLDFESVDITFLEKFYRRPESPTDRIIRFVNVRQFSMNMVRLVNHFDSTRWLNDRLEKIEFNHLESFTVLGDDWPVTELIAIIVRNRELKSVGIACLDYDRIMDLVQALPELVELTLYGRVGANILERLLNGDRLHRIAVVVKNGDRNEDLANLVPNIWTFEEKAFVEHRVLTFVRRMTSFQLQ